MKRSELTISAILVPLDYLALLGAAAFAYRIRFQELEDIRPIIFSLPFSEFLPLAAAIATVWIVVFAFTGLYATTARRNWRAEFVRIVLGSSTGFALILAIMFFSRELFSSRFILLASWLLAIVFVTVLRLLVRIVERVLFAHGIGVHRIALIGRGRAADALADAFAKRPSLGFRIVAQFDAFPNHDAAVRLEQLWTQRKVDEVIDATTPPDPVRLQQLMDFTNDHHIPLRFAADLLTAAATRVEVEVFAGVPLVGLKRTPLTGWGRIAKRTFDVAASLLLLIALSPILLLIALAVRITSRGPILIRQERVGQGGRTFTFLKFRSMRHGAHAEWEQLRAQSDRSGPVPKIKNDPRVTRVGKALRRWSLDELPQLWNVLTGTMSLVGPRPHLPEEVADYERRHRAVLALRPGITGLAQVSGRADLEFSEEARIDTFYIEHWTLGRDLVILLRTPFAVLRAKGAY
ncbi:MAG: sugar transferase [bacterium]|nr:sugar transferase [bacterium]